MPAAAAPWNPACGRLPRPRHRQHAHPRDWRAPLKEGRFLVLSPFPSTQRRPTAQLAARRNELVADLARQVLIVHAAPGGKTEAFARKLAESGKPLLTLDSPANANLMEMGARAGAKTPISCFDGVYYRNDSTTAVHPL